MGELVRLKNITSGSNIAVSPMDIKLGEDLCVLQFIDDVGDERKWVLVLDGDGVESSVVLHWV